MSTLPRILIGLAVFSIGATSFIGPAADAVEPNLAKTAVQEDASDPSAETPEQRDARMQWWREAKFGLFVHWGLYAIPGGEWNGKPVGGIGEWIMDRGRISVADYRPLQKQFNPVKFDADQWVRTVKNAGMKYIVITSKHHDGFCLFDSKHTDYDVMGSPFQRDIMKELADACHREGIKICWYHSIMDWQHPDYLPRRGWEKRSAQGADYDRYVDHMKAQIRELLTDYGEIGVMWFDGEWEGTWTHERGIDLYDYCRRLQPSVIVNNRVDKGRRGMAGLTSSDQYRGDFGTPEQEIPSTGLPGVDWETCMTMNNTWGFKKNDHAWKSNADLIRKLVDIASKNGNFLLNVGPTPEGEIPAPSIERLEAMGRWMNVNGQSIYGTQASPFKRLAWGRCTRKTLEDGNARLYLHVFDWPADGKLVVPGLANEPIGAFLLADADKKSLDVARSDAGPTIQLTGQAPDEIVSVVVLDVKGEPEVATSVTGAAADGSIALLPESADLDGHAIKIESTHGAANIGYWTNAKDTVSWNFRAAAGEYVVELTYACEKGSAGSEFEIEAAGTRLRGKTASTGAWNKFETVGIGTVDLKESGKCKLTITPLTKPGLGVMNVRQVVLRPKK